MKSDKIYIGNIMCCTDYQEHTTFSSTTLVDNKEVCSDSFGYIEEN